MWPFRRNKVHRTLGAQVFQEDGRTVVDVQGQTCPGYLLSINRAVDTLAGHTPVTIRTSYAPCGTDVEAWCREKGYTYESTEIRGGIWNIRVMT